MNLRRSRRTPLLSFGALATPVVLTALTGCKTYDTGVLGCNATCGSFTSTGLSEGTGVTTGQVEPTTGASTTEASTTEASTTEASTTEASTTEASTTEASTTEASTTETSTTGETGAETEASTGATEAGSSDGTIGDSESESSG